MSLETYIDRFRALNVNQAQGRASPHKICMLLALLDLARSGGLTENRLRFLPPLLERYRQYFEAVRTPRDHPNPWFPFFHLQGKLRNGVPSFWHLKAVPGREIVLSALDSARSARILDENVDYAFLDDELFSLLQQADSIEQLSSALAVHFDRGLSDLTAVVEHGKASSIYEHRLRDQKIENNDAQCVPDMAVRDPAFRRLVTEVYDYRCSATGLRLVLSDGTALVEAAHIRPFSDSRDDDPRNGLALTPNMHWAMDQHLIAPGPDYRWHVSATLDDRLLEHQFLLAIRAKPLFLPTEKRWYPRRDVLEWNAARLL